MEAEPLNYLKTTDVVGEGHDEGSPRCERVEVLPLHALRGSEDDKSPENLEVTDVVEGEHAEGSRATSASRYDFGWRPASSSRSASTPLIGFATSRRAVGRGQ